ncbi:NAD(P)H nitroreductase [Nocardioides sp. zg-DK7169]|uniref:Acg family FMN-binding oxidoreductase n=1 Tax=Nocardioides sp. zg-DK7169 TaxID=2736600 RepID=UPI001557A62E|nr:NAD(P)H nitroreductase [Nocardioides sp. zg-DK7169]NPC96895.1 NAD(P)H nitroreductase [Nocardioides sp. zg-DK7169]
MGTLADIGRATSPAHLPSAPDPHSVLTGDPCDIVVLACRAPSVHNTQPWRWRVEDTTLELYADRSRALAAADPSGRNLALSCGAALHHAQVAARALGWVPDVTRLPDPAQPDLLARIRLRRGEAAQADRTARADHSDPAGDLQAIRERRTDRRRFTSWPVPPERLDHLASEAREHGGPGEPVVDAAARFRLELLIGRAMSAQEGDDGLLAEQRAWIDHSRDDGIPSASVPEVGLGALRRHRFAQGGIGSAREPVEASDGVLVLGGPDDTTGSWLRTGEGLSALWLLATRTGLAVVPLSQVVEVDETRHALQHDVLGDRMVPHLVVRVGWLEISRSTHHATPRRPLDDVLLP